ncbi:hypothetical protein EZH22_24320 [Xanthobacter dioxanivorans]|uniref:Transmembrane protein n=1 Tax=Xanthobacter dioxanivorans TaxID=2528964 RepID=A0A974PN73_9HYPH|nr:hypothetical protein [Xanthobacter dioxanivorans]QRG06080.1 hypothetical protein EZH22_24320 [Xanthobacter dioxanivorans]
MATGEVDSGMVVISREELREVMREEREAYATETSKAVQRAFMEVGLYADDSDERKRIRADFHHLRRWRELTDVLARQIGITIIGVIIVATMGVMWVGAQISLMKPPHP